MTTPQKFDKEKVQVECTIESATFTKDKSADKFGDAATKLIAALKTADWDFKCVVKKDKVERIMSITYPQLRNGHQGENGHTWQWQLDTETMGKHSTDRLYLDDVKATISSQKIAAKTVKVGKDDFKVIEVKVKLSGTFSADTKH